MQNLREVVITGVGVVSPLGIGQESFYDALLSPASGISQLPAFTGSTLPFQYGGVVPGFDGKDFVQPRKTLKVMSREIQIGFSAAWLAMKDAGIEKGMLNPDRLGVVMGSELLYGELEEIRPSFEACNVDGNFQWPLWADSAMKNLFPLWMLKYLPNMAACHIGIAHDARGPNNSIVQGDVSSLLAVAESTEIILRGHADVMLTGGSGSNLSLAAVAFRGWEHVSKFRGDPTHVPRIFDARHDGLILGEGAGALVLESREHAERRGAKILARVVSTASRFEPASQDGSRQGTAIRGTIVQALTKGKLSASQIGHVTAGSSGVPAGDRLEAQAIRQTLGDVPVTALKSRFGHLGAGGSAVELVGSVLAVAHGTIPATANYEVPCDQCPVNVIRAPLSGRPATSLILSQAPTGQAAAVLISAE